MACAGNVDLTVNVCKHMPHKKKILNKISQFKKSMLCGILVGNYCYTDLSADASCILFS